MKDEDLMKLSEHFFESVLQKQEFFHQILKLIKLKKRLGIKRNLISTINLTAF